MRCVLQPDGHGQEAQNRLCEMGFDIQFVLGLSSLLLGYLWLFLVTVNGRNMETSVGIFSGPAFGCCRLRAPTELFALLHAHYDRFKHECSGTYVRNHERNHEEYIMVSSVWWLV